jgi:hypothetical protein
VTEPQDSLGGLVELGGQHQGGRPPAELELRADPALAGAGDRAPAVGDRHRHRQHDDGHEEQGQPGPQRHGLLQTSVSIISLCSKVWKGTAPAGGIHNRRCAEACCIMARVGFAARGGLARDGDDDRTCRGRAWCLVREDRRSASRVPSVSASSTHPTASSGSGSTWSRPVRAPRRHHRHRNLRLRLRRRLLRLVRSHRHRPHPCRSLPRRRHPGRRHPRSRSPPRRGRHPPSYPSPPIPAPRRPPPSRLPRLPPSRRPRPPPNGGPKLPPSQHPRPPPTRGPTPPLNRCPRPPLNRCRSRPGGRR